METLEQKANNILSHYVFIFDITDKRKKFKQLYKVDFSKEVKVNGNGEKGYMMLSFPDNLKTNQCMTYIDIMLTAKGQTVNGQCSKITAFKLA